MAKQFTEKSRYPSKYSPENWVTAAQYITELVCSNKSKQPLPIQFYELPEWQKYFRWQVGVANKLLKKYSATAIINVLKSSNAYALHPKWVEGKIQQEYIKLQQLEEVQRQAAKNSPEEKIDRSPQKTYKTTGRSSKNLLSKLDE